MSSDLRSDLLAVKDLLECIQQQQPIKRELAEQIRQLVERRELRPLPLLRFIAEDVKFGDTFKTKGSKPVYGMAFATAEAEHLNRLAFDVGLEKRKVMITIQAIGEK